jgi:hypothetical protein
MKNAYNRYRAMSLDELREATKAFDRESVGVPGKPVRAKMRAVHERVVKGKRGRPVKGRGAERVTITLERGLLGRADEFASAHNLSRSELIAAGLRLAMERPAGSASRRGGRGKGAGGLKKSA